jgi:hypothetical protein
LNIHIRLTGLSVKKFFAQGVPTPYLFLRGSEPVPTILRRVAADTATDRSCSGRRVACETSELQPTRLHNQRPALPSSRQNFYEHFLFFQPEGLDYGVSSVANEFRKRHL